MNGRSLVDRATDRTSLFRFVVVAALILLTVPVGAWSITLSAPGAEVAAWWPAAGLAVIAVMVAGRRRLLAVLAIAGLGCISNLVSGRPFPVALGFGAANAAEAWVVVAVAAWGQARVQLATIVDAVRFIIAAIAGATLIGVLAAVVVVVADAGNFAAVFVSVAPSHASAVLLIVPLAMLPTSAFRIQRPVELIAQTLVLAAATVGVFWPGQRLPFAFVPFPVLTWGSLRFGTGILMIETLAVGLVTTVLTQLGGGPFAVIAQTDPMLAVHALQAFLIIVGSSSLVLGEARTERERLVARVKARELVVRSGVLGSTLGFVILESDGRGVLRMAAFSESARGLVGAGGEWRAGTPVLLGDYPQVIAEQIMHASRQPQYRWSGSDTDADGVTLEAHIGRIDDVAGGYVVTVEIEDVSARMRAEAAIANALANEQATVQQLEQLRSQQEGFVSAVTHELRNPLTSIRGFVDLLDELQLPTPAPHYIDVVSRNARRLALLVDDLLEAARIGAGADRGAREECDIDQLLAECAQDLTPLAASKDVTLLVGQDTGESVVAVRGDVERVLTNLASNAVKFSPNGTVVRMSAQRATGSVVIRIVDEGPGIAADELERVFERFYRSVDAQKVAGTGLGLAITRALAQAQGGTVTLESDGATGTTAVLTLPAPD